MTARRISRELRALTVDRRDARSFSPDRWLRALLVEDSSFAEMIAGAAILGLRGILLWRIGYVYADVALLLESLGLTADRLGTLLLLAATAQVIAVGTQRYGTRAFICFCGAVLCLAVYLAYIGVDRERTAMGLTWFGLMVVQVLLCIRILLTREARNAERERRRRTADHGNDWPHA